MTARIAPLMPPYSPEVRTSLEKWMPPGAAVEPLVLFRTVARYPLLSDRMRGLGAVFLGRGLLPKRVRELLILRTCARCQAEYEWGVHVTAFATSVGLDPEAVASTLRPASGEGLDTAVLRFADELHDTGTVSDATWETLASQFEPNAMLEMLSMVGFYHAISFIANATRLPLEPWAARMPAEGEPSTPSNGGA
ncbi:carboxymuconolactone decarboxylase family protein [Pendulispora rubella]|uniref:Carboxymuconolactone decarboxylase family protein n=1 Tax=Pendulispora rubella TaxID=2741070 RepID=A0ABZ2L4P2_9BACT